MTPDRARRTLTASLVFVGICTGVALLIRFAWPYRFWSFQVGRPGSPTTEPANQKNAMMPERGISVRILESKEDVPPLAIIPRESIFGFWQLLDVDAGNWNKFHLVRQGGKRLPIAPKFPLLSELADIEIENIDFSADQMDELRAEVDAVQKAHVRPIQNGVLLALANAVLIASAENKGLRLSPFG